MNESKPMRYTISYVDLDGNMYDAAQTHRHDLADAIGRWLRDHHPRVRSRTLPIYVADRDDEERGNVFEREDADDR